MEGKQDFSFPLAVPSFPLRSSTTEFPAAMIYVEDKSFLNFRNYFMTWGETKTALLKDEWSGVE